MQFVRRDQTGQRIPETLVGMDGCEPLHHVGPQGRRGGAEVRAQSRAPLDDIDDVLEIMACRHVATTPRIECFELRCEKRGRRNQVERDAAGQGATRSRTHGFRVPRVGETQDCLARGHQINLDGA